LLSSRKFADAADAELATFLYAKTAVTTLRSATRLRSHGGGLWLGVKERLLTPAGP